MAAGHRRSNPTRKRGRSGVNPHCMSHRPQRHSYKRNRLSRRAWTVILCRVGTLPPLRFGLLADAGWPEAIGAVTRRVSEGEAE